MRRSVVGKGLEPGLPGSYLGRNFIVGKLYRTVWPVNEKCRQLFPNLVGMYRRRSVVTAVWRMIIRVGFKGKSLHGQDKCVEGPGEGKRRIRNRPWVVA